VVKRFYVDQYVDRILAGDRVVLSRAITLAESTLPADQELAQKVIQRLMPHTGNSIRVGITGSPGVGKSTFIETFGNYLVQEQHKRIAVLAIDPSSQRSGGSILGDKTRMASLATNSAAYIRPSPAGKSLGGVARNTREAVLLCEAAGFNVIIIETVGVGQSETVVHSMVDFFLLLLLAGAGDELQGIKKGIVEMADGLAITKADGPNSMKAKQARAEYQQALHLYPPGPAGLAPQVQICSALENTGIADIWEVIAAFVKHTQQTQHFTQKRQEQNLFWLHQAITSGLEERFFSDSGVKAQLDNLKQKVAAGEISPFLAASELLNLT